MVSRLYSRTRRTRRQPTNVLTYIISAATDPALRANAPLWNDAESSGPAGVPGPGAQRSI